MKRSTSDMATLPLAEAGREDLHYTRGLWLPPRPSILAQTIACLPAGRARACPRVLGQPTPAPATVPRFHLRSPPAGHSHFDPFHLISSSLPSLGHQTQTCLAPSPKSAACCCVITSCVAVIRGASPQLVAQPP